jgi:hypothetical protein
VLFVVVVVVLVVDTKECPTDDDETSRTMNETNDDCVMMAREQRQG